MINEKVDQIFNIVLEELNSEFIGQETYFEALCQYFRKKIETETYGSLLLVGEPNTFKKNSVNSIFRHLNQSELLGPYELAEMDMENYEFKLGFNVFLTDLIHLLKSDVKGLIFKNIERASAQMLQILTAIEPLGKIQLEKPYTIRDMFLVEIEEAEQNIVDESYIETIECPDKYYIFSFNRRTNDQLSQFLEDHLTQCDQVLYTRELTKDEKLSMMQYILYKVLNDIEEAHQIKIKFNPKGQHGDAQIRSLYKYIASFEEHEKFSLMEYTRYKISAPLDKLLREKRNHSDAMYLYVMDNEIFCRLDEERYNLKDYVTASLSEVKYRLQTRTGLIAFKTFMAQIENNFKVQNIRKQMGLKTTVVNLNTVFTGNAGTGKSESAQLMYDYLLALGVLQSECFISVSQSDFMAENLNKLRENVRELFKKALGGMLFIDEISSIFDSEKNKASEAFIRALSEEYREYGNELVMILSGKDDEMLAMIESHGLEAVFPNRVHFTDYTPSEMYEKAVTYAGQKGYAIAPSLKDELIDLFDKTQIKEKKGLGNARFVRNIVDRAIAELRKQYLYNPDQVFDTLTKQHFNFKFSIDFDLESRLSNIIGLDDVKNLLRAQYKLLIAQEKRRSVGVYTEIEQNLNMVFAGNPGTGKTSIARLVAEMLSAMGFLKNGQLIEADRSGFVSDMPGETSKKTELKFKEALGGILFIDEAYTLASDAIGREAIETLLKLIEDYSKEVIVILAGYTDEMEAFFDVNIGLRSRFPLWTIFKDYVPGELFAMAKKLFKSKGFRISKKAESEMAKNFIDIYENADMQSGNGRLVRNYVENLIRIQSIRIAEEHTSANEMNVITATDIERYIFSDRNQDYNFNARLETYTGNSESKQYLLDFYKMLKINDLRKKRGYAVDLNKYNNMVFTGEMGTGKHKMIDLMGELLTNLGFIKSKKPYELNYEEILVNLEHGNALEDIFNKGIGRIILIDNADRLIFFEKFQSLMSSFIKFIDKNKQRTYFILNCSQEGLSTLFASYPSLAYRFPMHIHFENYSSEALQALISNELELRKYVLEAGCDEILKEALDELCQNKYMVLKNGLLAKQFLDYMIRMQSVRIFDGKEVQEKLMHIEAVDIINAKKKFMEKNT
ncbi:AAA family ATPase [Fusibacter sp. 3D3]|uniref:AAA family ATPase n=1 Tax=Fusibacter sp. 3D3 TaxID=1048380 RepID=UPI000852A6F2|nr:AAA family ATPase [Fusibacter sp. 3D3]GAU75594.1 stage V sporulation protein K [Fusibacter sp. 3D3]